MSFIPPARSSLSLPFRAALLACATLALSACGGVPHNRTMMPEHQPVVSHATFTLDVTTTPTGLPPAEEKRLSGWFDAMGLRYGDKVMIDDPLASDTTRAQVAGLLGARGLALAAATPLAQPGIEAGTVRISLTRASASVPGCPDWSANSETNMLNGLHPNFGCATNSNMAAMVANPDDLIRGATSDSNPVVTSNKAISTFQDAKPSGNGGTVKSTSSKGT
ncbi:MAG: CpaD family pilus assembly protein [Sphingomonadales bacterium]|nr:CpaD family pilus assembly protein [Sphingomonadales bacterium]MDE2168294.1 CpaD family pilus assembly protein [Sphingomonadales bacterium]